MPEDRPLNVRYAPPRKRRPVAWRALEVGDWAYVYGYWHLIEAIEDPRGLVPGTCDRVFTLYRPDNAPGGGRSTSTLWRSREFCRATERPAAATPRAMRMGPATAGAGSLGDENGHLSAPAEGAS